MDAIHVPSQKWHAPLDLPQAASPGDPYIIDVFYHGKPKQRLSRRTKTVIRLPWATIGPIAFITGSLCWTIRQQSHDHFQHHRARGSEVVANGRLDHVETTASGQRTWTYSEGVPIPPIA